MKRNKGVHKIGFEEFLVAVEEVAARKVSMYSCLPYDSDTRVWGQGVLQPQGCCCMFCTDAWQTDG